MGAQAHVRSRTLSGRKALLLAVIGALTFAVGSCTQQPAQHPSTSTDGATVTLDPNRPPEAMADLPQEPAAMTAEIRRRLLAEWVPILQSSGLTAHSARLWFWLDTTGGDGWRSEVEVSFGSPDPSQWPAIEAAIAKGATANGWGAAGVSHGLNVRKGPFFLRGGCAVSGGCAYQITAPKVVAHLAPLTDEQARDVPELAPYLAPTSPT